MPKFNKKHFQQLIAQGETKVAIAELVQLASQLRPESLQNEVTHLSARWNDYERQSRMNTANIDQLGVTKRQIDQSLLQLLNRVEEVAATRSKKQLRSFWIGMGTVVAILSGIVTIVGVNLKDMIDPKPNPTEQLDTNPTIESQPTQEKQAPERHNDNSSPTTVVQKEMLNQPQEDNPSTEAVDQTTTEIEFFENGKIDWQQGYVEATGFSVINTDKYKIRKQAVNMATIGAKRVAQANLLEIIEKVKVTRTTTVEDFMTTSDVIKSQIEGTIRNTRTVGKPTIESDYVELTVRMPLDEVGGLKEVLINEINKQPMAFANVDLKDTTGTKPMLLKE